MIKVCGTRLVDKVVTRSERVLVSLLNSHVERRDHVSAVGRRRVEKLHPVLLGEGELLGGHLGSGRVDG